MGVVVAVAGDEKLAMEWVKGLLRVVASGCWWLELLRLIYIGKFISSLYIANLFFEEVISNAKNTNCVR